MPETRFTEFPTLSVDPRVVISRSASEITVSDRFSYLCQLNYYLSFIISLICF